MPRDGRDGRDGVPGPVGPAGRPGVNGRDAYELALTRGYFSGTFDEWMESLHGREGPSAFEHAQRSGFAGTEAQWLESLVGKQGEPGPQGPRGPQGPEGQLGPMPQHEWRGTELRFQQGPRGETWGPYIDLKGPAGEGTQGFVGGIVLNVNTWMPSGW